MKILNGLFVTFEGGEGTGKSTQSLKLKKYLTTRGFEVELTKEPGGTSGAEEIRKLLLSGDADRWDALSEALLYLAARAQHWKRRIEPKLAKGAIVISDRFHDSSVVYQGLCRGVDIKLLNDIFQHITKGRMPDRTYLIMVPPKLGLSRSLSRTGNNETRFECMNSEFHEKVFHSFQKIYENSQRKNFCHKLCHILKQKNNINRFLRIDGTQNIEQVFEIIQKDIDKLIDK